MANVEQLEDVNHQETFRQPKQLQHLRSSIVAKPPYCQGTLALPQKDFTLFYGTEGDAQRINLSRASAAQLQHLADTCAPASFGVGGEDIYDETYRKAGKLDCEDFAITFDASRSCLADVIRNELLVENPKKVKSEDLNIELYKLNVYGKDAFFKAHVDTPRSELMFGSLVIVFPTPHEGGALKLRASGHEEGENPEWTFDSSALLAQQEQPSIAYVAFFSDVEHEVMPVTSGHRVTITYNLFYVPAESEPPEELTSISTNEQSFKNALQAALEDQSFLPTGGNLMFGLKHQYPLATYYCEPYNPRDEAAREKKTQAMEARAKRALHALEPRLKASDRVIFKVLRECALDTSLKILHEASDGDNPEAVEGYVMADGVLPMPTTRYGIGMYASEYVAEQGGQLVEDAVVLMEKQAKWGQSVGYHLEDHGAPVYWVDHPRLRSGKGFKAKFATYGNESALGVVYWSVWIFVRIGPAGQREMAQVSEE
ncbi:hypothetical protein GSI_02708 [Ganoderma sinense ZZ0214-1]|uniref:Fe2OG dioxygenase domain-containing protein n=1 Tax=Ganoderma sinense ZZ0214-1 TaxID=1077348 RepID=A0A2G8SMD7_9APHY|nr:hypothetical protein GSI_02708 [Ganoderma sinense ZZ0214-1]